MQRPEVLDRLQKLLSKTTANGATEAEAQTALAMAQRLMDEHNLTSADIRLGGEEDRIVEFVAWEKAWSESHYIAALDTVQKVFSVTGVARRYKARIGKSGRTVKVAIVLYGDAANVEAASWALEFLATAFKGLWDRYRVAHESPSTDMLPYYLGLGHGFAHKSEESRARLELERPGSRSTLAIFKGKSEQAAEMANPGMKLVVKRIEGGSSYDAGVRDGGNINLARPLGGRVGQIEGK